ncbi:MAG: 3-phosphoshikimate 1-carboxyvinyltransferase [Methylomarinum sp.]|nr:3-phosphoshikimate 1-carboxyvinyltransferase [Methylomarinum sp.]
MSNENSSVRSDPFIKGLLKRLPDDLETDFTDEQLTGLKVALARQQWNNHPIDFRHSIGLLKWRYYFVFIAGRDLRVSRLRDRFFFRASESIFLTLLIIFMSLFGLLLAYLIKSALGIDLVPGFSLGIWAWFKGVF